MCGINGIVHFDDVVDASKVTAMNTRLEHRGPNHGAVYAEEHVVLGHRRLSIIDLDERGNQPMSDPTGRYHLVYNGEIYNYQKIKELLTDHSFQTETDTEVVLAAWQKWGLDCLRFFNGMFAFAIWDKEKGQITVARDRLGIKPLYYHQKGGMLLFSSELRALLAADVVSRKMNTSSLTDYLRYQTVHAPNTIIEDVKQLEPGHYMQFTTDGFGVHPFWVITDQYKPEIASHSKEEVQGKVKELFYNSVERRLVADVPFGAFLSGGIDSSAVVGVMSEVGKRTVDTFSVVFEEDEFSEAPFARMIAEKFKTNHHEIKLTVNDFLETVPDALKAMDHPSGDGPNTYVVSKATKNAGITMALSGLGGDELFAGYPIFKRSLELEKKKWLLSFPKFMRGIGGNLLKTMKPGTASDKTAELLKLGYFDLDHTYPIARQVLLDDDVADILEGKALVANQVHKIANVLTAYESSGYRFPMLSQVSFNEMYTYMQNVLLRDTDQMSMAVALEVRTPFLDHTLVEYVINVSDRIKYPHTPKQLLTESLGSLLPREIIDRPKMGFTLPWEQWLKQEMRSFAEERLNAFGARDGINQKAIERIWQNFLKNDPRYSWSRIWPLVVLEDWLQQNNVTA